MKRRSLLAWLVLCAALYGCGRTDSPPDGGGAPTVHVSQPLVREITDYDSFTGRVVAVKTEDVRSRVRGHLVRVAIQDGQIVTPGELLFEIDPRPYKAALDKAEAQQAAAEASLKLANAELARARQLLTKGAASREELDVKTGTQAVAAADVLKAKAAVEEAKLDLGYTQIRATTGGRVSKAYVTEGNLVNAGGGETLLTTIVSIDPIYVEFPVDERTKLHYAVLIAKEKGVDDPEKVREAKIPVEAALADDLGYRYRGTLDFIDNRVNPATGTVMARGAFPNKERILTPGLYARVRIPASDPYKALLVTERAVGTDQGLKYVYVINNTNIAERRDVKLGTLHDGLRVIQEGLKPSDWVVVRGVQHVRIDEKVTPQRVPMPK